MQPLLLLLGMRLCDSVLANCNLSSKGSRGGYGATCGLAWGRASVALTRSRRRRPTLPVRAHLTHDGADLGLEPQAEHPVGLIEDDEGDALARDRFKFQHVDEASLSRGGQAVDKTAEAMTRAGRNVV